MKQNNDALSGLGVGGAHAACGDSPGGEHHRLPEGPSGSESGFNQIMPFVTRNKLWQWRHIHNVYDSICGAETQVE